MFTGLVQAVGRVGERRETAAGVRLVVDIGGWSHRAELGESICVSGCCLTVAEPQGSGLAFDVVPETLARTTLGDWDAGRAVNLEKSLRAADLMGGHVVQGHVDGVGEVARLHTGGEHRVTVRAGPGLIEYAAPKGSVAIDGVSLTVAAVDVGAGTFDVALIPVTLAATTLGELRIGSRVNLEMDAMAKTIVHYLRHFAGR